VNGSSKDKRNKTRAKCTKHDRTDGLSCVCFNARNMTGMADEFKAWITTWNYDIVATTETWMKEGQQWQLIFQYLDASGEIERVTKRWGCCFTD